MKAKYNLQGKICLLTGATGGIGAAMATALDNAGATLILVGRNQQKLQALQNQLQNRHQSPHQSVDQPRHKIVAADLTTVSGRQILEAACNNGIDLLINNAGINQFGLFNDQSEATIRAIIESNTIAPMLLTQQLLPLLHTNGIIVNVGSGFGSIGFAGYCTYSASKFALRGFTEALRRELADSTIRVLYLAPRATNTDMNSTAVTTMNRELGNAMDTPAQVAAELLQQLHSGQANRYIGWPERFFIKLNNIFPGLVDKALHKQLPVIRQQALAASRQQR